MKRVIDLVVAAVFIVLFFPLWLLIALIVRIADGSPIFFRQERIGRLGEPFELIKFRTMRSDMQGRSITSSDDARITRVGGFLRRSKLDEAPQLINVIRGEMSLVGPRPEVPRYVDMFAEQFEEILTVRPGITGAASVRFRSESELLAEADDPEALYVEGILPKKIEIERAYVQTQTLAGDLALLWQTAKAVVTG